MAMLAERKQKQKWTLNPRGKYWSDDSNKFGQRMLEKMGWSAGKGLGAKEDGITEHIKQAYKNDAKGIGYADKEDQWTKHEVDFTSLLKNLSNTKDIVVKKPEMSLEKKSQSSRARVHYHKFTRGKDLSRYSEKDLANVFGRKTLKSEKTTEVNDESNSNSLDSNKEFGVLTVNSGNMADYFKTKIKTLTKTVDDDKSDSERPGFGFNQENKTSITNSSDNLEDNDKPKSKFWHMFNKSTESKVTDEKIYTTSTEKDIEIKKVEKKRKNKTKVVINECFDNPGFTDFTDEQIVNENVKKIKQKKAKLVEENSFENSAFEDFSPPVVKKSKKRKLDTILEESSIQNDTCNTVNQQTNASVESLESYSPTKKKLKKDKKKKDLIEEIEVPKKGKSKKLIHGIENEGCTELDNLETIDVNLSSTKKREQDNFQLDTLNDSKSSKKKKKTIHEVGIYNEACTEDFKNDIVDNIENVPQRKKKEKKDVDNNQLVSIDIKSSNKKKKTANEVGIYNVACTEDFKNDIECDIENVPSKKKKDKKKCKDVGIVNMGCTEDSFINTTEENEETPKQPKKSKKKKILENGVDNVACTANTFQQDIEEAINSMSNEIDDYQLELENQLNERKASTQEHENIGSHFRFAKKSVRHLISGDLRFNFKGSNLAQISGYGIKR